ncbi:cold shock domain-containing protein [Paraglaciecola sp. L3A3]|uniref:cold shock domain-containing protein n=1 Tax=Paraglaciecola sp. L3A3 TaxID=2686358 RepID=UPI00131DEDAE|nr:cold shock domain-containing protein [Paraglaciecola sp. L3A3]
MQGNIVRWNDDRGFGFISSKELKGDVFAHISQFKKGYRRPKVGDSVIFQVTIEKGKQSAISIALVGVPPTPKNTPSLIAKLFGFVILVAIATVFYRFVIQPKLYPAYEEMGFSCQGKTHCSQLTSCDEAKYYLAHCPNMQIDGDNDGEPCERQLCNNSW